MADAKVFPRRPGIGQTPHTKTANEAKPTPQHKEPRKMTMNKSTQPTSSDMGQIPDDARALMATTADAAGEEVGEARQRLVAALERVKEIAGRVRDKAAKGARAADVAVRQHPYQAIGVGVGIAALIGYLVGHRSSRNGH
jgi:ElaB/YqjD/DUF883 family membrane-anchored ribosome-binding protein